MKIILQHEGKMALDASKMTDEELALRGVDEELAFDTTAFDEPGWVSIEVGGVSVSQVHINALYPAVAAVRAEYDSATRQENPNMPRRDYEIDN